LFTIVLGKQDRMIKSNNDWHLLLAWYVLFGALHEVAHLVAAAALGFSDGLLDDGIINVLFRSVLLRQSIIPALSSADIGFASIVRHSGWMASIFMAFTIASTTNHKLARTAAVVTALEAISTDLLGLYSSSAAPHVFFCGNFGVLLIHKAWSSNGGGTTALDILSTMVRVNV